MNFATRTRDIVVYLSSFLLLTACSPQYAYHQTENEVQEIKNLPLDTFIREKIIGHEPHVTNRVGLSVLNPVSKVVGTLSGTMSINEELEYRKENFIYRGFFDSRSHVLTKPKKDIELFCKVNGGRLLTKKINKTNFALGVSDHSLQNFPPAFRKTIERDGYQLRNHEAESVMSDAINEESFGEFSCAKDNNDIWSTNIVPLLVTLKKNVVTGDPIYEIYMKITPSVHK